jgi:hypothetical protein
MRKLLLPVFLLLMTQGFSQLTEAYKELRTFSKKKEIVHTDTTTLYLENFYENGLHYLYPLYKAFSQEQKLKKADSALYYDNLTQALAFTGDYASVLELEKQSHEKLADSTKEEINRLTDIAKNVVYTDARKYILEKAKTSRVVMINEAHDKPLHRAFTASLLEDLYKQGFHYLAMEMLSNYRYGVKKVNAFSGYFCAEPIAGELIRKAMELGYTLVPYEDTSFVRTPNEREYAQAKNIYTVLKRDTTSKMIVLAGYAHIEEGARSERIPMASYFKALSGIDPLTIDQTEMSELGTDSYTAMVYDKWRQKNPFTSSSVAIINDKPFDPFGWNLYDIHVMHPPTKYINGRPVWMAMNGWKRETPVTPAYQSLFMVQAYYEKEYNEKSFNQSIPADQTYITAANGLYYLYLRKGKYKTVFRDKEYKVLGTKDLVVD